MDSLEVGGLRIAYERAGSGPPLVLLHGFVGDNREWRGQVDGLSDEFTVIAWDAPGAGRSSDPPEEFRIADYADCLAAFMRALGFDRTHVAGLSFGGVLALELYRRHPEMPTALVLAGAYAGWAGSLPAEIGEQRLELSLRLASGPPEEFVRTMIPGMFSGSPRAEIVDELGAIMAEFHPAGFAAMARSTAEADLRDVLPRIHVPTLLLYGDEDARSPLDIGQTLHAAIPGSTLVVMPGVGHMSNVEAPELMNTELRAFFTRADAP
jgi:pimeloyl-ACP methyl ester carboxylesterase